MSVLLLSDEKLRWLEPGFAFSDVSPGLGGVSGLLTGVLGVLWGRGSPVGLLWVFRGLL